MSKFKFSLKTVEKYRNIILDDAKANYAKAVAEVNKQIERIKEIENIIVEIDQEINTKNTSGMSILEYQGYKRYIKTLQNDIKEIEEKLVGLRKIEQRRRTEMVTAKTDVMSIEKLHEKKLEEYKKEETKKEELKIDEFVSNKSSRSR